MYDEQFYIHRLTYCLNINEYEIPHFLFCFILSVYIERKYWYKKSKSSEYSGIYAID
jgi:hypothetical protein